MTTEKGGMPPKYVPGDHESSIRARWDASRSFHADPERVLGGEALPYTIVIPPPNVTAALHLGHALNNTLQDVLIRARRMMGFETLWMPGTDHAGIATQTVVEKRVMAEEGKRRTEFERDEFVAKVQAFKDEYEAKITEQLKRMGCSCDWDRQRFTMDDMCAKAVREAFFRLFKDGLIYRGKRLVNWDPVTQTALADDEVEMKDVDGHFYYLRYPLVHPPKNPDDPKDAQEVTWGELATRGYPGAEAHGEDDNAWVTVATTRPETYLGDTGVAINPDDLRAKPLKGLMVQLPLVGRVIRIVEDDYVVMPDPESSDAKAKYATGFLKVTPAHDTNDYDIGQRHELEIINVMAPDASISDQHGWERESKGEGGHVFLGKSREDARELVVKEFRARNLLEAVKPYSHSVGHSYRSHAAIEPYMSDQWYVAVTNEKLRGAALHAMHPDQRATESFLPRPHHEGDGELTFHPNRYAKTFEQWHEGLRDWCISRQLWWGHRIPVFRFELHIESGEDQAAAIETVRAILVDVLDHHGVRDDVTMAVANAGSDEASIDCCFLTDEAGEVLQEILDVAAEAAPKPGVSPHDTKTAKFLGSRWHDLNSYVWIYGSGQDPDVLDTWFSSALWPMSTMGWPGGIDAPAPATLLPEDPASIQAVFVKQVGTWHDFIGDEDAKSGELIERLLSLRDHEPARPLVYELFSESDMSTPLRAPEDIQEAKDLVCAVGVRADGPVATQKFGEMDLGVWLGSHGFAEGGSGRVLEAFNPTSVLCTAREIITLWVSRMVMFNRYFLGDSGGTALRAVSREDLREGESERTSPQDAAAPSTQSPSLVHAGGLSSSVDSPVFQARPVPGFEARDPFPSGERSPRDLEHTRRNLPHLALPGATYFVTWRTSDGHAMDPTERGVVIEALQHWQDRGATVFAATVMPDHVHALLKPGGELLPDVLSSIKRYTARSINEARGTSGSFWQDEHFDRIVRDEAEFAEHLHYIVQIPCEGGLSSKASAWDATVLHGAVVEAWGMAPAGGGAQPGAGHATERQHGSESRATVHVDGRLPFKDVFIHAMIQDGEGQKMSKSLGNGVDPTDIIESHGSDAMRFTLVKMTTQTQDVRMPVDLICPHCGKTFQATTITTDDGHVVAAPEQTCPHCSKKMVTVYGVFKGLKPSAEVPLAQNTSGKFDEARNFCNKLWNASRFAMRFLETDAGPAKLDATPGEMLQLPDRWILSRLASTITECEHALATYQFSVYATAMYDFLWRDFCDWYLEAIKPTIEGNPLQRSVLAHVLDATVRLLHPIAPFITETIFEHLRGIDTIAIDGVDLGAPREGGLLATAGWPRIDDSWKSDDAEAMFARVQGLVSTIREVRAQHQVPPKRKVMLHAPEPVVELIALTEPIVSTLAGLEGVTHDDPSGPSVPARFEGHDLRLSKLVDEVDADAERARIERQIADLEKKAGAMDKRLSNPGYVEKAPAHLVEQSRKQLAEVQAEIESLRHQMEELG